MTSREDRDPSGYLHGYSVDERERLRRQAQFLEPMVHDRLPFRRRRRLLEVGAGVGAQTEILLRHFPELHITGIEINDEQIAEARRFLATVPWATGRFEILKMNATRLEFEPETFDAAFLCWVLEHVGDYSPLVRPSFAMKSSTPLFSWILTAPTRSAIGWLSMTTNSRSAEIRS
jgi:trans-aconitate methyltransferase